MKLQVILSATAFARIISFTDWPTKTASKDKAQYLFQKGYTKALTRQREISFDPKTLGCSYGFRTFKCQKAIIRYNQATKEMAILPLEN